MPSSSIRVLEIEEIIEIDKQRRGKFKRVYSLINDSDSEFDLNSLTPFSTDFDKNAVNLKIIEQGFREPRFINTYFVDHNKKKGAKWTLKKEKLSPQETYAFSLEWEAPHFVDATRDFLIYYHFSSLEKLDYRLKIYLPKPSDLLHEPDNNQVKPFVNLIKKFLWPVQYSANINFEKEKRDGRIQLKHEGVVSKNSPFQLTLFYWLELSPRVVFILGFISGIIANIVASFLYDWIKFILAAS